MSSGRCARTWLPMNELDVEAYERDGAICLRGAIDASWVERMQAAVDRIVQVPGPYSKQEIAPDGTGRFHNDMFMWARDDDFHAFVFDSPAADVARAPSCAPRTSTSSTTTCS